MNSTLRRAVALPMLIMVTACSTMQPVAQPQEFLRTRQPSVVWLSQESRQSMISVDAPRLIGDSIVGFVEGEYVEIHIASVKGMQARQYSRSRTTAFVLGIVGVAAVMALTVGGGLGANHDKVDEEDIGILPVFR